MDEEIHYNISNLFPGTFFIHGAFDESLRNSFIQYLIDTTDQPQLSFLIDSRGGELSVLINMGNLLKLTNKPSIAIVTGVANSCAFFFLQYCTQRLALSGTTLLPHFGGMHLGNSDLAALYKRDELFLNNVRDGLDHVITLTQARSLLTKEYLIDLFTKEPDLSEIQAKKLNLIDKVINYDDLSEIHQFLNQS